MNAYTSAATVPTAPPPAAFQPVEPGIEWIETVVSSSVSDPGSVGSVIFSRIRIRLENNGSLSGSGSQICQKLFISEQNINKCKAKNAKFLLNVKDLSI